MKTNESWYIIYLGLNNEYISIDIVTGLKTKEGVYKRIMNNALILAGDPQNLNILYIALSEYKIRLSSLPKASYVLEHLEVVDSLLGQIDNILLPAD